MIVDLSLHTVEHRLARFLVDQAVGDSVNRKKWATQVAIASHLGTVPVVLNRALRGFVEEGLIDLERERIHIRDRAGLEKIAAALD
jgi:CRP-like cAMP-binding protein